MKSTSIIFVLTLSAVSAVSTMVFMACGTADPATTMGSGGSTSTTSTGSDGTGTGGSSAAVAEVGGFCKQTTAPYCAALFACCADKKLLEDVGGTVASCTETIGKLCNDPDSFVSIVAAGNTVLNQTRVSACVARLDAMKGGGAACTQPPAFVYALECYTAFQGTQAIGAACDSVAVHFYGYLPCLDGACASDNKCVAYLPSGAACDPAVAYFEPGNCNVPKGDFCVGTGAAATCGPQGAVGAPCGQPGVDGVYDCASASCGADGKCVAMTAAGLCSTTN